MASSRVRIRNVWALPSKPPHSAAATIERVLAVVPERRVAEVMSQAGRVDDVRVAAERGPHLAADLSDFERMGQSGTGKIVLAG